MPLYQYQAFDLSGKKRSGYIEAQDERDAKEKLRDQGVMVASLSTKSGISSKQNIKGETLVSFTVLLSQMLSAGVPLYQSLSAIEEQYRGESYHRIILSLCDQIKAGTALSDAMAQYPQSFSRLYCSMIRAGESVGALNIVLQKLSQLLARQMKLKSQIQAAMIYPAILASFSLLVIGLLLWFVVPSIEGIFSERKLNGFTQAVLTASHIARNWWWLYLPIIAGGIALLVLWIRSERGQQWIQRNFLKLPLIRTLMIQASLSRFTRTMGTLQEGGLTMIDSLRIAREVMGNVVLEGEMKKAETKIIEGSSLSAELSQSKWVPMMVSRMLAVGEESGSTTMMLNKIAEMYEESLEKTLSQVMALAQPAILILMGAVIGSVLFAILLPLTDISSLAM